MKKLERQRAQIRRAKLIQFFSAMILTMIALCLALALQSCVTSQKVDAVKFDWPDQSWTEVLTKEIDASFDSFDRAEISMREFCPSYSRLSRQGRVEAWGRLFVAVSFYESTWRPAEQYKESTGAYSIGLFQLSYGDKHCPKRQSDGDLTDPKVNIICAVRIGATLVSNDRQVASGGYVAHGAKEPRGLARYWSVIRDDDRKRPHRRAEIKSRVSNSTICQL